MIRTPVIQSRGKLPISKVNEFKKEVKFDRTAANAPIPILYGRVAVDGIYAGYGLVSGDLVIRVIWGFGEIKQIEECFINDVSVKTNATIKMRHYRGSLCQGLDEYAALVWTSPAYIDDLILRKPAGMEGLAYTVFRIPTGAIDAAPRFRALIQGLLVNDPQATTNLFKPHTGDPFFYEVGYSYHFVGTDNSKPTNLDASWNSQTMTWLGNAKILSNKMRCVAVGDYVTVPDAAVNEFGTGAWTFEIRFSVAGTGSLMSLCSKGADFDLTIGLTALYWKLVDTGGTNIIASTAIPSFTIVANTEYDVRIEFSGNEYSVWVNGARKVSVMSTAKVRDNATAWSFGLQTVTVAANLDVRSFRFTKGALRYGGNTVVDLAKVPFTDSFTYVGNTQYSDNTALCFADLATNLVYGLGATVKTTELPIAQTWDNGTINGVTRSKLSLVIDTPKKTEEWLDLIATYGDFIWYLNNGQISMLPDRKADAYRPSGEERLVNGDFLTDLSGWTLGGGITWGAPGLALIVWSTAGETYMRRTVSVTPNVLHAVSISTTDGGTGSCRIVIGGTELTSTITAGGTFAYLYTPTTDSVLFEVYFSNDYNAFLSSFSVRPLFWEEKNLIEGSLSIDPATDTDTPNKVLVTFTKPVASSANWLDDSVSYIMPEADVGLVPLVETTMQLPACVQAEEAAYKAKAKCLRLQNRIRYSWKTTDVGLGLSPGDIVYLPYPLRGVDAYVQLDKVDFSDYGRYSLSGLRYTDDYYPEDAPASGTGTIPVGAIIPLSGNDIPAGWAAMTAADTKFLMGTAGGRAIGTTGGAATYAGFSGNTDSGGDHNGQEGAGFDTQSYLTQSGSGSGYVYEKDSTKKDAHTHSLSTGTITPNIDRRENILIEKITSTATVFPKKGMVFGKKGISVADLVRSTAYQGKLLKAAPNNLSAGLVNEFITLVTGSGGAAHAHHNRTTVSNGAPTGINFTPPRSTPVATAGGAHTHAATLSLVKSLKRYRMALYSASADFKAVQDMIVGWRGSLVDMPDAYWTLCNGLLGTPNMEDYMVEIAGIGNEGTVAGDNTLKLTGAVNPGGAHDHDDETTYTTSYTYATRTIYHGNSLTHIHNTMLASASWTPPWYALAFLMYNPSPVLAFADVGLLLGGGQANGSTTVVDESSAVLSPSLFSGAVAYSTGYSRFSFTSLLMQGCLKYNAFKWGRRWTVEMFIKLNTDTGAKGFLSNNVEAFGTDAKIELFMSASTALAVRVNGTTRLTATVPTAASNTPFYLALQYEGVRLSLYIGTVASGVASRVAYWDSAGLIWNDNLYLGDTYGEVAADAYFEEVRFTRGAARHTATNISIPTAKFARL